MTPALRVLFLSHYYRPEIGAPQTRLHETARRLVELGIDVRIMTGPPHYPSGIVAAGHRWWWPKSEVIDGIPILRLPMIPRPNGGLLDRVIDNGSLAVVAMTAIPAVRWADVILVESPPLFLGLTAAFHRAVSRRPYVFHVADPWPDFPIAMGMLRSSFARRLALLNEIVAYRSAAAVTTVTPSLVARLERKAGAGGKVRLLPNGVDVERFDPTVDPSFARRRFGWPEARLSLAYVGTVGLAQGLGTLMSAMAELQGSGIVLHVVGGGAQRSAMVDEIQRRQLRDIVFHEPVQADEVPAVLAAADAVLVLLRRGPLYDESLPTKLVEGLAAGRPIIVSADGEAARIVRNNRAGSVAPAEDAAALAKAITQIGEARDRRAMGRRGRALAESEYARAAIVERLAAILATAAGRDEDRPATI